MSQVQRALWVIAGSICLLLGVIGIFLPLLPTTPFILLTAICWARGSTKFYDWLVSHRVFGKMVRDWESHRVIPLKAKWLSTIMMNGMILLSVFYLLDSPWWAKLMMVLIGIVVSLWIWSFPSTVKSENR